MKIKTREYCCLNIYSLLHLLHSFQTPISRVEPTPSTSIQMLATDNDDERTLKLQRQLNSKGGKVAAYLWPSPTLSTDDEIRSYENKLFMANNDYHDLQNNYKDANYRVRCVFPSCGSADVFPQAARESERANKLENMSIKHNDEIKKLKLQVGGHFKG